MSGFFIDNLSKYEKTPLLNKFDTAYPQFLDYLTIKVINILALYIPPVLLNNLLIIVCVSLVLISSYFLFLHLTKNKKGVSLIFSLIYSFSAYFISRVFSFTPALYWTFVFPLALLLLLKNKSPLILGLFTFISFLLSSYYGYFVFIFMAFWILIPDGSNYFKKLQHVFFFSVTFIMLIAVFFWKPLISNLPFIGNTNIDTVKKDTELSGGFLVVYRPIQNWYGFSFRPWYFVIPPRSSLFFGNFSKQIYDRIAQTDYYLADDYSDDEMAGVFPGWHFIIGTGFVLTLLVLEKFRKKTYKAFSNIYLNKKIIFKSTIVFVLILLISGPPSFTVHGFVIFTPSYLLYFLVPGFRTLVRWVSVLYLLLLIINLYLVLDLYTLMKNVYQKVLLLTGILALNFVITAVKIPVLDVSNPPEEISFLRDISKDKFSYAVYPKGDYYSLFWILSHKKFLINAVGVSGYNNEFDAEKFSRDLLTDRGYAELTNYNASYLVYYPNKISGSNLENIHKTITYISSKSDIEHFFSVKYGEPVRFSNGSLIYRIKHLK